jgi:hypothetical protein
VIRVRTAAVGAGLALAAGGLLTACSASAPSARTVSDSHGHPQAAAPPRAITEGSPVCQNITALDHLTVRRTVPASVGRTTRFAFPSTVRISDAATVRRLARGLCGLPALRGDLFCPFDSGIRYALVFAAGSVDLRPVVIAPAGCEPVTGLGRTRSLAGAASWWATLGDTMKIPVPGQAAFSGAQQSGG